MIPLSKPLNQSGFLNNEWVQYLNKPTPLVLELSGSYTPNGTSTNSFQITLSGSVVIQTPVNVDPGTTVDFEFIGTGGITFSGAYLFPGGVIPTWAGNLNFASFYYDGSRLLYVGGGAGYA